MRRFELSDLGHHIAVALTCLPKQVSRGASLTGEQAVGEATDRILRILSRAVILVPDAVHTRGPGGHTWGGEPGEFGVTEPWPFEEGHRPPKPIGR